MSNKFEEDKISNQNEFENKSLEMQNEIKSINELDESIIESYLNNINEIAKKNKEITIGALVFALLYKTNQKSFGKSEIRDIISNKITDCEYKVYSIVNSTKNEINLKNLGHSLHCFLNRSWFIIKETNNEYSIDLTNIKSKLENELIKVENLPTKILKNESYKNEVVIINDTENESSKNEIEEISNKFNDKINDKELNKKRKRINNNNKNEKENEKENKLEIEEILNKIESNGDLLLKNIKNIKNKKDEIILYREHKKNEIINEIKILEEQINNKKNIIKQIEENDILKINENNLKDNFNKFKEIIKEFISDINLMSHYSDIILLSNEESTKLQFYGYFKETVKKLTMASDNIYNCGQVINTYRKNIEKLFSNDIDYKGSSLAYMKNFKNYLEDENNKNIFEYYLENLKNLINEKIETESKKLPNLNNIKKN